jgi:hypothetical protein
MKKHLRGAIVARVGTALGARRPFFKENAVFPFSSDVFVFCVRPWTIMKDEKYFCKNTTFFTQILDKTRGGVL